MKKKKDKRFNTKKTCRSNLLKKHRKKLKSFAMKFRNLKKSSKAENNLIKQWQEFQVN